MMTGAQLHNAMDLAWRVGEMPTERCEHSQHKSHPQWHKDGDEHYVMMHPAPCGHGVQNEVMVLCLRWLEASSVVACSECGEEYPLHEFINDLGPVRHPKNIVP
jgi:hypothetical protein